MSVPVLSAGAPPAPPPPPPPPSPPPIADEAAKLQELAVARRRATGLLVVVAVVFVLAVVLGDDRGWQGYVRAMAEASLVGGLADWFAVVALFRHPLGIPIPHTAVVVERKEQFGRTLGGFVQGNFLNATVIGERIASSPAVPRLAGWLAEPANAAVVAGHLAGGAVALADVVGDDDVHRMLDEQLHTRLDRVEITPLLGRGLAALVDREEHRELVDAALRGVDRFLEENREDLKERFGRKAPWWLPGAVDDRIFARLLDGVRRVVADVVADPHHELRADLDERLRALAHELQTSPDLRARGEELKRAFLATPEVRAWSASLWADVKATLRDQAVDPASALRTRLAGAVAGAGRRLGSDPALTAKAESLAAQGARTFADRFSGEISDLVTGTVARWDAREAATRLELLLGPDLQFIRINGTVVGGVAGLALHAISDVLG